MEKSSFSTIEELQAEIGILRMKRHQQETAIQEKFIGPGAVFKTIVSLFKSDSGKKSLLDDIFGQDIITNISRIILPVFLNNSLFRKSGFITKALVALFSQKAAKNIDNDFITTVVEKIKSVFSKDEKTKKASEKDYGIPPDSETY